MSFSAFQIELNRDLAWRLIMALCAFSVIIASCDAAFASAAGSAGGANDVVGNTLCRLVQNLSGGTARGIATIAIFSVGVGLFMGKMSWPVAAATAVGVGIIFSAPKLVAFLSGDSDNSNCPTGGS